MTMDAGMMTTIPFTQPVALAASGTPLLNPRSCVTCRQRKVRCDKLMPCTNCRRAQSNCVYPAPGRAPRRPRASPRDSSTSSAPAAAQAEKAPTRRERELMQRLRVIQGVVADLIGELHPAGKGEGGSVQDFATEPKPGDSEARSSDSPSSTQGAAVVRGLAEKTVRKTNRDPVGLNGQLGRLVLHGGGKTGRYVNSGFISKLNDELDALRNDLEARSDGSGYSSDEELNPDALPPQEPQEDGTARHSFLFGYRSADVDFDSLHPSEEQIRFLWRVYQENVEVLLKVLHIPTMENLLNEGIKTCDMVPGDEALVFAIYYAAVASMEADEVQDTLGASQSHLLAKYRFALEQAVARANFLTTTDMAVLQAFTIFLTIVKRHDDSNICWTLTSVLVRMAQALGLHRDGGQLGLPPFEVEMRRRLWWAIMAIDLRSAQEQGSDLAISDRSFDTQLPSNINDADISPTTTDPVTPREGRSDTAVCLVRYEVCALHRRLFTSMTEMGPVHPDHTAKTLEERERMLIEVYDSIERKFLKHMAKDDDPIYWMASLVARVIMAKTGLIIYQPVLFPGTGPELSDEIRSRLWISTIEIVEYNFALNTDDRCRRWRWFFQTYRQWHAIAYMLLEASSRPWTVTSERAWEAAQILGHDHPMESAGAANHSALWMPIKKLFLRTKRHRTAEIARLRADPAAAQRLDVEDRLNPRPERLGPVPGMEMRMPELRLRWRTLVRADVFSSLQPNATSIIPGTLQSPVTPALSSTDGGPGKQPEQAMPPGFDGGLAWSAHNQPGIETRGSEGGGGGGFGGAGHPTGPAVWGPTPYGNHGGQGSSSFGASPAMFGETMSTSDANDCYMRSEWPENHSAATPWLWPDQDHMNAEVPGFGRNGNMPALFDDMDMSLDATELGDIDWGDWQRTLKGLSKPAAQGPPQGMGRWGGT